MPLVRTDPPAEDCAGIFKQSMGARNRVGIGLSYQRQTTQPGGFYSLESILELLKSLKIRALMPMDLSVEVPSHDTIVGTGRLN
jgi:hypothetical protein